MEIQRETSKWLKYTKSLRYVLFKNAVYQQGNCKTSKEAGLKGLENMKRTKIMKVAHSDSCRQFKKVNNFPLYMDKYPSTLQEISINLESPSIILGQQVSMHKFQHLRKLELLFPLDLRTAWMILQTIPNPQLLTCLGFYLKVPCGEFDREIIPILSFIMNCPLLEKITIQINYQNSRLKALRLPPQNNLKALNFGISVNCDRHLREIGAFLLTTNELESLNLRVNFNGKCEAFVEFCESLRKLTCLKKLCLKLNTGDHYVDTEKISLDLLNSIACLDRLEEICVYVPDLFGKLHARQFFGVLGKIADQLKKIELEFCGKNLYEKDLIEFFYLLGKVKNLMDLRIDKFSIEDLGGLLKFKQVLEGMESVKKIYWRNFVISREGYEILFEMIMSLLEKKGVEELVLQHSHQWNVPKIYKSVVFEEVLKKNPWLKFAKIESQMVRDGFFSRNFDICKQYEKF